MNLLRYQHVKFTSSRPFSPLHLLLSTNLLLIFQIVSTQSFSFHTVTSKNARTITSTTTSSFATMDSSATSTTTTSNNVNTLQTSNRIRETLDPCVILMKQIIAQHEHLWPPSTGGIYSLAQGVVYWTPPPSAYEALSASAASGDSSDLHQYCPDEGLPALIEALETKLAAENGLGGAESKVIVTSGANQAYVNCVLTLLSEGEGAVVFRPYYFNHVMAIQMCRGEESLVVGPVDEDGIPDLDWLRGRLERERDGGQLAGPRIRMVTVVNPGNPTGVSMPRAKLEEVVRLCGEFGVWLVMDNTYEQFDHVRANRDDATDDDVPFRCFSEEHVINIFSFSKGYAMAGFRVGYVVLNTLGDKSEDAYEQMLKVQDTVPICTSRISQTVALGALSAGRSWVSERVATLSTGRDAIRNALSPLSKIIGGSGAMYFMGKLPDGLDDQEVANTLVEKHGVAVIPGSFCGYPGWIRICYSNLPPEKCLLAAERLSKGILEVCNLSGGN